MMDNSPQVCGTFAAGDCLQQPGGHERCYSDDGQPTERHKQVSKERWQSRGLSDDVPIRVGRRISGIRGAIDVKEYLERLYNVLSYLELQLRD